MTGTTIPDDVRAILIEEAGSASIHNALDLWTAGQRREALQAMWDDREWLHHFVNMLDAGDRTTEALIDEVSS